MTRIEEPIDSWLKARDRFSAGRLLLDRTGSLASFRSFWQQKIYLCLSRCLLKACGCGITCSYMRSIRVIDSELRAVRREAYLLQLKVWASDRLQNRFTTAGGPSPEAARAINTRRINEQAYWTVHLYLENQKIIIQVKSLPSLLFRS